MSLWCGFGSKGANVLLLIFQTEQLQIFVQCFLKDTQITRSLLLKCLVCSLLSLRYTGLAQTYWTLQKKSFTVAEPLANLKFKV